MWGALPSYDGLGESEKRRHPSIVGERWRDNDELRFSTRGLHAHLHHLVRHVFLVVGPRDDILPSWLKDTHPGLTVVSEPPTPPLGRDIRICICIPRLQQAWMYMYAGEAMYCTMVCSLCLA